MEASSGPRQSSTQEPDASGDGADRISALPDDLLLLVLARLPCAAAAARTGVLSRRWLGLWHGLRQIVFRGVALPSLEEALGRVTQSAVSLLKIRVPVKQQRGPVPTEQRTDSAGVVPITSLLRAAARLKPEKIDFRLPSGLIDRPLAVDLPCFHRATSIALDLSPITVAVPAGADFPTLEKLSLARCSTDLDALLSCCPRLRTLRLSTAGDIRVNSPSLQELVVRCETRVTRHVDIVAPALKHLAISSTAVALSISVLAPMVEKVSWHCLYLGPRIVFGLWSLNKVRLQSADRQGEPSSSLCIYACAYSGFFRAQAGRFKQEIEKHMVASFSGLELHLTARGHAFGGLVFHLLGMNRIRTATRRLKVVLERSTVKEVCPLYCPCESNWRSQAISLDALEEVEFNGFDGADHEFDFLELILGCAPTLKRMIVKLSEETSASNDGCTKIDKIFKACSSVECDVYHSSGLMYGRQNCPST